jgi:cytoskeletal protein RodZ
MKKTGEMLQNLRIERGVTLAELSSVLKINSKVLQALEEGNAEQLPKPPFVRGFIKSYVLHLKSDPEPFLKEYQREIGSVADLVADEEVALLPVEPLPDHGREISESSKHASPVSKEFAAKEDISVSSEKKKQEDPRNLNLSGGRPESKGFSYSDFDNEEKQRDGWRVMMFSLVVFILSLVIYVTYRTIDRYQREARVSEETEKSIGEMAASAVQVPPSSMPLSESALPSVVSGSESQPPMEGEGVSAQKPEPSISSTVKDTQQKFSSDSVEKSLQDVAPDSKIVKMTSKSEAKNSASKLEPEKSEQKPQVVEKPEPSAADAAAPPATPPQRVREVVLEALGDVVIEYQASGKSGTLKLKKDQIHVLRFTKSTTLKIDDAGSVNVSVDGTDRGVPGEKGNSVVVQY